MKLKTVQIWNYKCINDSNEVDIADVTCLVGKNESGKTAFLQALSKFNPLIDQSSAVFNPTNDFPRARLIKEYENKKQEDDFKVKVITVKFELDEKDIARIVNIFGRETLTSNCFTVDKYYESEINYFSLKINEKNFINYILGKNNRANSLLVEKFRRCDSVSNLVESINNAISNKEEENSLQDVLTDIDEIFSKNEYDLKKAICNLIQLPKIFYFDDYSIMAGEAYVEELMDENTDSLDSNKKTLIKLLDRAGITKNDIVNEENKEEYLKAKIEAASNEITDLVFGYWKQNTNLSVEVEIKLKKTKESGEANYHVTVRIKNEKHRVTVPFNERSKGFIWFFFFLDLLYKNKRARRKYYSFIRRTCS